MKDGKMHKIDTKILLLAVLLALLYKDVYGTLESIPLPKLLSNCFKQNTRKTSVKYMAGEEIHTLCMYEWEINYAKNHPCYGNGTEAPAPSVNFLQSHSKGSKVKANKRRGKRRIKPEQILDSLIHDFKNRDKKRRKRWYKRKIRKEYRMLTNRERRDFHKAINMLKNNKKSHITYDYLSQFHQGDTLGRAHGGPNFPGWHRVYILYYELLLDYFVPGVTLPYWDSTIDKEMTDPAKSIIWTETFMGNGNGIVTEGPFKNWRTAFNNTPLIRNLGNNGERLISKENVSLILSQPRHSYIIIPTGADLKAILELQHNGPHVYVGGHMSRLTTAAMDPMFFMHHCFMDYIWEKFRNKLQSIGVNPELDYPDATPQNFLEQRGQAPGQPMPKFTGLRNIDGYSRFWTEFYYTYQDAPSCHGLKTCGSPYLECLRHKSRCSSVTEAAAGVPRNAAHVAVEMAALAAGPPLPPGMHGPQTKVENFVDDIQKLSNTNPLSITAASLSFSPPSLRLAIERDHIESCLGQPIQNTFGIDCVSDVDKWAFFAVQIIHLRTERRKYNEQIIRNGKAVLGNDMFSPENYEKLKNLVSHDNPGRFSNCRKLKSGASRIFIQSYGLSYSGVYKEYAFVDERQPLSSTIGYTAVKKPTKGSETAYITAIDSCGRLCKPKCLVRGSNPPKYKPCSGSIRISARKPLMYGNTYGDAILDLWRIDDPDDVPLPTRENVFLVFYCDYKNTWPWQECNNATMH